MLGYVTISLAVLAGIVPAAFAEDSRVLDHFNAAGTAAVETPEPQTHPQPDGGTRVEVAVPIGKVCVGPDSVAGDASYVRRTKAKEGMAIVEVSTTPFMPVLASNDAVSQMIARPDQPAGW